MIEIIFQKIPQVLYEPIAFTALAGLILGICRFRKKIDDFLVWCILGMFVIGIGWRLGLHSMMVSKRYFQILIYPGVILAGYFAFRAAVWGRWLLVRYQWRNRKIRQILRYLPWVIVLILAASCLLKINRFDAYRGHVMKVCREYQRRGDSEKLQLLFTTEGGESGRIAYYAGLQHYLDVQVLEDVFASGNYESLRQVVELYENVSGEYYFIIEQQAGQDIPAEALNISDGGVWEILCREFTSKKQRRELVLYRYIPGCPNVVLQNQILTVADEENFCRNGNFEEAVSQEQQKKLKERHKQQGLVRYCENDYIFPRYWNVDLGPWNAENPPIMYLSEENPLQGKRSFVADTRHTDYLAFFNTIALKKREGYFDGYVKGLGDEPADVWVIVRCRDEESGSYVDVQTIYFQAEADKIYRFHGEIDTEKMSTAKEFFLFLKVKGCVQVDNVAITSAKRL